MSDNGDLFEITKPCLLVGEGKEESRFFTKFLGHLGLDEMQVRDYGGKRKLPGFLAGIKDVPGFPMLRVLCVSRDADSDTRFAFESVHKSLRDAGLIAPAKPAEIFGGFPAVGVFILPDCKSGGMLESLCLRSVAGDAATKCVDQFVDCVRNNRTLRDGWIEDKARVHAFLASRDEPDLRLGEAAERGYWPFDHPAFLPLKQFLREAGSLARA